jgi:hypothetical protein
MSMAAWLAPAKAMVAAKAAAFSAVLIFMMCILFLN